MHDTRSRCLVKECVFDTTIFYTVTVFVQYSDERVTLMYIDSEVVIREGNAWRGLHLFEVVARMAD